MCSVVGDAFALAWELASLQAIASWDICTCMGACVTAGNCKLGFNVSSVSFAVYNRSS